ncbi:MAG TPA: hypothetical protein VGL46_04320 [Pseudonocardiaceae bacterium]
MRGRRRNLGYATAWIAKEELRALCATAARGGHRDQINQRLWASTAGAPTPTSPS